MLEFWRLCSLDNDVITLKISYHMQRDVTKTNVMGSTKAVIIILCIYWGVTGRQP